MAGGHDAMVDPLAGAAAAEMAVEASIGAGARIVERYHAPRNIRGMVRPDRIMTCNPPVPSCCAIPKTAGTR